MEIPLNNFALNAGYPGYTTVGIPGYPVQQFLAPVSKYNPSIRPLHAFNVNEDAEAVHKAIKGLGTNDKKLIKIICRRTSYERQQIARAYSQMYSGKDLASELEKELSGDYKELVIALMEWPAEYDAKQLHRSMNRIGTIERILIEILCTRTNAQIYALKNGYKRLYGKDLVNDIKTDTSGYFEKLLKSLASGSRDESGLVNPEQAAKDAKKLHDAGEGRLGTNESSFIAILTSRNFSQLRKIFDEYEKLTNHPIENAIESEFSGDIKDGLLAMVKCIRNRLAYFAELLHDSMKGIGTRDTDLIRICVTRADVDLRDIAQEYEKLYGKSLEKAIEGDTSGHYQDALITLVRGNY